MIKIKQVWIELKSSFWFVPSVIVLGSIVLAIALVEMDGRYSFVLLEKYPKFFGLSAEASRGMLSTIASSMMSMMTVAFSMTLVTLALASSQYTSRILRNFMRSKATQVVLGVFAGTFIYCLIVLRTIQGGGNSEFVPSISVLVGFLFSVAGVGFLVAFIHHIASSIQASNIISSVADETIMTITRLFPDNMGKGKVENHAEENLKFLSSIVSSGSGYIQNVDEKKMLEIACKWNLVFKMNYGIGDFVVIGMPLVLLPVNFEVNEDIETELRDAFIISRYRTIEQDTLYGIRQIVDVALKALSPGVNDTTTAVMCVDYLTSILAHITMREIPSNNRYVDHELRIIARAPDYEKFLNESFSQIRSNSKGNVTMIKKIMTAIEVLSHLTTDDQRKHLLSKEARYMAELLAEDITLPSDKDELASKLEQIEVSLSVPLTHQ